MTEIYNGWGQLQAGVEAGLITKRQAVAVSYTPHGRAQSAAWHVWSPYFKTNPDAAWYDNGMKSFLPAFRGGGSHKADKQLALEAAMAWAEENYGVSEWKRNRMGDYIPAVVQKAFPIPRRTR